MTGQPKRKKGAIPMVRKPRARPVKKAPPPDDPYSEANLVGKCKRCVGKGELYVTMGANVQRIITCTMCDGSGLEDEDDPVPITPVYQAQPVPAQPAQAQTTKTKCQDCDGKGWRFVWSNGASTQSCTTCGGAGALPVAQPGGSLTGRLLSPGRPVTYHTYNSTARNMMSASDAGTTFDDFFKDTGECAACEGSGIVATSSGHAACGLCSGTGRD